MHTEEWFADFLETGINDTNINDFCINFVTHLKQLTSSASPAPFSESHSSSFCLISFYPCLSANNANKNNLAFSRTLFFKKKSLTNEFCRKLILACLITLSLPVSFFFLQDGDTGSSGPDLNDMNAPSALDAINLHNSYSAFSHVALYK